MAGFWSQIVCNSPLISSGLSVSKSLWMSSGRPDVKVVRVLLIDLDCEGSMREGTEGEEVGEADMRS